MNTQTQAAEAVGSSEELGHLFVGEAYHQWLTQPAADAMRCVDTRAAFEAGWSAAMAAERDRCAKLCEDEARIRTEAGNTQADEIERLRAERDAHSGMGSGLEQKPAAWACIWPDECGGGGFTTLDETTARNYMAGAREYQPGPKLVPLYAAPVHVLGDVLAEAAKSERRAITFGDIVHTQVLAMRAAVVDAKLNGPEAGMAWIKNTLEGPGHLPDIDEARALGGAQALWDKETAEHEAFRAAHPAP